MGALDDVEAAIGALESNVELIEDMVGSLEKKFNA